MKKIYSAPSAPTAHIACELLEDNGIEAVVQGESLPILAGEIPWQDTWPSVWVNDADEAAALALLKDFGKEKPAKEEIEGWTCPTCGEKNSPQFDSCWKCAAAGEPSAQEPDKPDKLAFERARQGLLASLFLTFLMGVVLVVAGFSQKAIQPWPVPYQMIGFFIFAIGVMFSLYFAGQVFEAGGADSNGTKATPSRWPDGAFVKMFRILLLVWLAIYGVQSIYFFVRKLFLLVNLPRWLLSYFLTFLNVLQALALLCCFYFIIKIIRLAKQPPSEPEKSNHGLPS